MTLSVGQNTFRHLQPNMFAHYKLVLSHIILKSKYTTFLRCQSTVLVLYQGITLGQKNLIFCPQVVKLFKRVVCSSPVRLVAVSHAVGKPLQPSEPPYQPQALRVETLVFSLLSGTPTPLYFSDRQTVLDCACLLHFQVLGRSLAKLIFFSNYITPLIYSIKTQNSKIREHDFGVILQTKSLKMTIFYFDEFIVFLGSQTSDPAPSQFFRGAKNDPKISTTKTDIKILSLQIDR